MHGTDRQTDGRIAALLYAPPCVRIIIDRAISIRHEKWKSLYRQRYAVCLPVVCFMCVVSSSTGMSVFVDVV